jgi:cAMP phosphodiesterase
MEKIVQQKQTLREIVNILIDNSLLLTAEEKQNFMDLTPTLDVDELTELFNLLVDSKRNIEDILTEIAHNFGNAAKQLTKFHLSTVREIFKNEREVFKTTYL